MLVSAIGELTSNEKVTFSLEVIQMPIYVLYLLGTFKILGLFAIWFSPYTWLKEWAYAGFVFDFVGAIFGFAIVGKAIMPDVVMAPLALVLCIATYASFKRIVATS